MEKDTTTTGAKQQISERIKGVSNILVTVSKNPTVDELSAAVALTMMLNDLDKHATAVFSGKIPSAIEFLEPEKTLENNVDSLRDFIIAIDREKADRLRYKVEGDIVRIYITPYRANISEEDLEFSHGDFNVELVLALGVENQDVLDEAIAAHGKILHDATVATINAQNKKSNLGTIDWRDENASSLCEMLVSIAESLKGGLINEQIATALLTGIVAATDRFSNSFTTSKSMTVAAQLMAAGANQQLVATKLENASEITVSGTPQPDGTVKLDEGISGKIREQSEETESEPLGQISIDHSEKALPKEEPGAELPQVESATIEEHDKRNKQNAGEEALDAALEKLGASPKQQADEKLHEELKEVSTNHEEKHTLIGKSKSTGVLNNPDLEEPSLGGVLNATAQEVAENRKEEDAIKRNKTILSHEGVPAPLKGKDIEPLSKASTETNKPVDEAQPAPTVMDIQVTSNEPKAGTLADIEADIGAHQDESGASLPPVPPPPLPDFSNLPPLPPTVPTPLENTRAPAQTGTIPPPQIPQPQAPSPDEFKIPGQ